MERAAAPANRGTRGGTIRRCFSAPSRVSRKAEVRRPVAVQVTDLPAADFEPELTKLTRAA